MAQKISNHPGFDEIRNLTLLDPLVELLSNNGGFETGLPKEVLWSSSPYFIPSPQAENKPHF
jgi:hypothetical protein